MIVLDTNVFSALMASRPDQQVVDWLDDQPGQSVWTSSITVFEVRFGLALLPDGRRRQRLEREFKATLDSDLKRRVLDLDSPAALAAGDISAALREMGRPVEVRDAMIAGVVAARGATLATRNTKHFEHAGISLVDPWSGP